MDALAAGHEAKLPAAALEPGTAPLGSGGYATVYSATLSSSCIAGAAGTYLPPLPVLLNIQDLPDLIHCVLNASLLRSSR